MSTTVVEPEATAAEVREALTLSEAVTLTEGALQPDGTVILDLLRPCVGRGRGKHLYTDEMLRENAHKLTGWKMYVDHESDEARKQAGGLPRSIRDLGGRIIESWWNPEVPPNEDRGFGKGAVQGRAKPTPFIKELVENDPEIVECSINSHATGVRPTTRDGQRVWLVEGIQDKGSVDWVTEAGAGGKVASLMESVYSDEAAKEEVLLDSLSNDALLAHIEDQRPELLEVIREGDDGADDEGMQKLVQRFMDNGMPRAAAVKAARKAMATKESHDEGGNGEVAEITAEALQEALASDEGRAMIFSLVQEYAQDDLRALVEAALEEEKGLIRRESQAQAERQLTLRDMRDEAFRLIESSKLPNGFQDVVKARFALTESGPADDLDQIDDLDDDGNVTKSASEKLLEAVNSAIEDQRALVGELRPAAVRGQGPGGPAGEGAGDGEGKTEGGGDTKYAVPPKTASLLQEAGFDDPDEVFAPVKN